MEKNIRVFVTGVAGMIGSNTARLLVKSGYDVVGIDNLWRGTTKNIDDLLSLDQFEFRHADVISDEDWYRDLESSDTLIHIADIVAGIGYVFSNEWAVFQKNILINTKIARVVHDKQPSKLIYLGTACSYPQGLQRSVSESKLVESDKFPAEPESGYGWSKLVGEIEFTLATKNIDTKLMVLDLHNVYGWPCVYKDNTAQVMPSLINKAINSKDLKLNVWGDGSQGRAFVHVDDVANAINLAIRYSGKSSVFMIGPPECTKISTLANIIQEHPDIRIEEIVFDTSKPTGDIGRYNGSDLAFKELGWSPKVSLESGIHSLIDKIIYDSK